MAVATVTVTVKHSYVDSKMLHVIGTLAITASAATYASNGLTVDFGLSAIKAQRAPQFVRIVGQSKVDAQTNYVYKYVPGTTNRNGKVKIFTGDAELAAAATPAGVSGDTIDFEAVWLGQN